ncbi:MAG: hypothetical protein QG655_7, partial [Actinomycetota bacterium]|nr:hypothetical protein [Actinomycetota bacterium]
DTAPAPPNPPPPPAAPPPPPTAAPLTGGGGASSLTDTASPESLLAGQGSPMQMMMSLLPMAAQMPSQLGGMASGGPLAQLPQQALQQVTSLAGQFGSLSPDVGTDALAAAPGAGGWVTATPVAGGPVAASLTGLGGGGGAAGGGGGFGGAGAVSSASALRSPGSWSSTVNAAAPSASTEAASTSRIAEARTGGTVASGMGGSPGAMMGPAMAQGAAGSNDDKRDTAAVSGVAVLSTAADAFRGPDGVPTISGGGGNDFATAKGGR